jgi:4-amino-4-deoxy-L-arabinose transferase-like glycosyltransferase
LLLIGLFVAAWLPRVLALDTVVTIDERKWLARAANFYQALSTDNLAATFQREHPGVTVMWAGMLGLLQRFPTYPQVAPGQFAWDREHLEAWLIQNTTHTPLELLTAGRWWITLLITLTIVLSYFPLRRLWQRKAEENDGLTNGVGLAFWGALYLAWSPFFLALSRQLHPDGLAASFIVLALLLFLAWLYRGQQWRYLIASGVVMGLAWLTKTPAIFLVPTGALLVGWQMWQSRKLNRRLLIGYVFWGVLATLTFLLLWPAMWLDPLGTLQRMSVEMGVYVERHTSTNYFWGQPTADPGLLFYPVAFLWRTTPVTVIGLLAAAVYGWRQRSLFAQPHLRQSAGALCLFALVLGIGMSIGAKKFDRYMLPSLLALDLVGLLGWLCLVQSITERVKAVRTVINQSPNHPITQSPSHLVTLSLIFLLHGVPGFLHYPYYLTYFNPLFGGSYTAPQLLFVGWGEGLEAAAQWLNEQPEAEKLRVVAWYADGPFSYYFKGQEVSLGYESPLMWFGTDYAVLYVNQWQRQLPSPAVIDYFNQQPPVHEVRFRGLELAKIYDMRQVVLPDFVDIGKNSAADFGGQIRLLAYDFPQAAAQPGDQFQVTLYLQSLATMTTNYNVLLRLVDQGGAELWREEGWPWGAPTSGWPLREIRPDGHTVKLPATAAPGLYRFEVNFYDPATFTPLPVTLLNSTQPLNATWREVALLQVGTPPEPTDLAPTTWQLGDNFALTSTTLPAQLTPGDDLTFTLQWESLTRTSTDYTVFVHVVNRDGANVAQQDQQPLAGFAPTRLWEPGLHYQDGYQLSLPADLPAGEYSVRVGLYTLDGGRLAVSQNEAVIGDFATLGTFTVTAASGQ